MDTNIGQQRRQDGRATLGSLALDILEDVRRLIVQEVNLAKHEILAEVTKVQRAILSMALGVGLLVLGGLLLIIMLVHLLQALTNLPLWACYAIVGGVLAGTGWFAVMNGKTQAKTVDFVPNQTIETIKETVRWPLEQTRSMKM